ncbi:MMPL family transporter [Streptomyces sp. NPDC057838]|uniref:MMPL family transporter n=1 Tax=unclassified Streptomyces TaxID=2593676 RepID=UPI0036C5C26A
MKSSSVKCARLVMLCAVAAVALAALLIPASMGAFARDGTLAQNTEATRARQAAQRLGVPPADLVLVIRAPERSSSAPAQAVHKVVSVLARQPGVRTAWSEGRQEPTPRPVSTADVVVMAALDGEFRDREETAERLVKHVRAAVPAHTVHPSGPSWTLGRIDQRIESDLLRAELLAAPVVFLLLLLIYGSLLSALMPVLVAAVAVSCTIPLLGGLAHFVHISSFAVNAALAIGFGLAVDYTLFLLARYREELAEGLPPSRALTTAVRTSGRSVGFSAAAVTACLAAITVVPVPLVRALALAGATVTVLSAVAALLLTPACVILLGPLCERGDPFRRWRRTRLGQCSPFWQRTARTVTRRWALTGGVALAVLALLAWPVTQLRLGIMDYRIMSPSSQVATAGELARSVPGTPEQLLTVVVTGQVSAHQLQDYEQRLARVRHIDEVRVATRATGRGTVLLAMTRARAGSSQATSLVATVRALPAPGPVLVGGRAADVADTLTSATRALPWALGWMGLGLTLLLGFFTRSLVTPLKALVIAAASLGAGAGAMVVLFQHGAGRGPLGEFTVTGSLDMSLLMFTLAIALALSVDYEVFLLGRIREEYQRSADNRAAVVEGIGRTGRLMTSAALAVAISTSAMITSSVSVIKMIGTGIAVAALIDAVLVRGVLVPAVMTALGTANWWLPTAKHRHPRGTTVADAGREKENSLTQV